MLKVTPLTSLSACLGHHQGAGPGNYSGRFQQEGARPQGIRLIEDQTSALDLRRRNGTARPPLTLAPLAKTRPLRNRIRNDIRGSIYRALQIAFNSPT